MLTLLFQPDLHGAGVAGALAATPPVVIATSQPVVDRVVEAIQGLPWLMHVLVGVAFVAGLALWVRGKPLFKPLTTLLAGATGALLGYALLPILAPASTLPPWVGMIAGGLAGTLLMLALHRLLAAMLFGAVLAVALATVTAGVLTMRDRGNVPQAAAATGLTPVTLAQSGIGGEELPVRPSAPANPATTGPTAPGKKGSSQTSPTAPARTQRGTGQLGGEEPSPHDGPTNGGSGPTGGKAGGSLNQSAGGRTGKTGKSVQPSEAASSQEGTGTGEGRSGRSGEFPSPDVLTNGGGVASSTKALWSASRESWSARWEELPAGHRMWILIAAAIGAVGGTLAGVLQPAWAAGVLSAIAGSGIVLASGVWLAHATGVPGHDRIKLGSVDFSVIWVTMALIGVAAQWKHLDQKGGGEKGGRKKARAKAAAEEEE